MSTKPAYVWLSSLLILSLSISMILGLNFYYQQQLRSYLQLKHHYQSEIIWDIFNRHTTHPQNFRCDLGSITEKENHYQIRLKDGYQAERELKTLD